MKKMFGKTVMTWALAMAVAWGSTGMAVYAENDAEASSESENEFEEITVLDNDDYMIRITGMDPDAIFSYTFHVDVENKTDGPCMINAEEALINGVQVFAFFSVQLEPGESCSEDLLFADTDVVDVIGDYTDIELFFDVLDLTDDLYETVDSVSTHIYPYGEEKAVRYEREPQDTDQVFYEDDQIAVIGIDCSVDDISGFQLKMYLVNKTGEEVYFGEDGMKLNGVSKEALDPLWGHSLPAGSSAFSSMYWNVDSLTSNQITEVESFDFQLTAFAHENFNMIGDYLVDEPVTWKLPEAFDLQNSAAL